VSRLILLNKPYGVLTQFSDPGGRPTLKDFVDIPGVYAAGRLDADSEGLVVLTDDGTLQARISHPRHKLDKHYWAQVEGVPDVSAISALSLGLDLGDFHSAPCRARLIPEPRDLWSRNPPIRYRAEIPTSWLEITLREGKNRQVRRMTAKVGYPTLRLIRFAIGTWQLSGLLPGLWREEQVVNDFQSRDMPRRLKKSVK
jgi:23S rRNA pseudouridine2457 synthase